MDFIKINIQNSLTSIKLLLISFFKKSATDQADPNKKQFWLKLKKAVNFKNFISKIFVFYILIFLIGSILLMLPGFVHDKYQWKFLYSFFNASSAFSDTGLNIPSAANDYTFWGQLVILILIQLGGFGVFTFKVMLFLLIGKKLKIKDLLLVQDERGGSDFGKTLKIIKSSFKFLFIVEFLAAVILFISFYFTGLKPNLNNNLATYHNFNASLWSAIFHSISAINNAGFDIVGNNSLLPYRANYLIQVIFLFEFIVGGIGFPTFYDLKRTRFGFSQDKKMTLFSKLNLVTYVSISVIGLLLVIAIEYGSGSSSRVLQENHGFEGFFALFFNTMSTRNAGFSTVNPNLFLNGTKIIHSILMFIGSAPSSTAGGIRTTTFAIAILCVISVMRSRRNINAFKRQIPKQTIRITGAIIFTSFLLIAFSTLAVSVTNPSYSVINILYMVCSAFGTTGLNTLSSQQMFAIGPFAIIVISILMFIGQLGISSTLLIHHQKWRLKDTFAYPEENVRVG